MEKKIKKIVKKEKAKIGRPSTLKGLDRISLSLSLEEKKELKRQSEITGSASISHYLRELIKRESKG